MRYKQKIVQWLSTREKSFIAKSLCRFYEPISYLFFGILTTLVNLIVYTILEGILGQDNWYLSNLPAILIAILFAYITNRSFVFDSDGEFWTELLKFFSARILISFIFEYAFSYILFNTLHIDFQMELFTIKVSLFKVVSQITVVVANYIVSKVYIFSNKTKQVSET